MKVKAFLAVMLLAAVAACSTTPPPPAGPPPLNPVGRYEFQTSVQGQGVTGAVEIGGIAGAYTGQITTSITPPLPISGVTVNGQVITVTGDTPDGVLTFTMNFTDGTNFTGGWSLGGDTGTLTGHRVS